MILSKAKHSRIIKLFGKFRVKDYYHIIIEYCNGGDLRHFIKKYNKSAINNTPALMGAANYE